MDHQDATEKDHHKERSVEETFLDDKKGFDEMMRRIQANRAMWQYDRVMAEISQEEKKGMLTAREQRSRQGLLSVVGPFVYEYEEFKRPLHNLLRQYYQDGYEQGIEAQKRKGKQLVFYLLILFTHISHRFFFCIYQVAHQEAKPKGT